MFLIFGWVENDVMDDCVTYLLISACSYPAPAMYRSFGKTITTLYLSLISNIINIIENIIGVFVLHAGVLGVAYPSLIARVFSALAITVLCFLRHNPIYYTKAWSCRWNKELHRCILNIAVPNSIENGVFQLVKAVLSSVVLSLTPIKLPPTVLPKVFGICLALFCVSMGHVFILLSSDSAWVQAIQGRQNSISKSWQKLPVFCAALKWAYFCAGTLCHAVLRSCGWNKGTDDFACACPQYF